MFTWPLLCITIHLHISFGVAMKTERVTLLTSPEFKSFLSAEAQREGVSVAELVRTRCEGRLSEDEAVLAALTRELNKAVGDAKKVLKAGLDEAQLVLAELRSKREGATAPARRTRKVAGARL
jgi:hypothetical protein